MKKIFKLAYTIILVGILAITPTTNIFSQDPFDEGGADVPLDGGLSIALAAGAGYLVKRRHDARKKKAEKEKELLP
jgi:hypothetical protein